MAAAANREFRMTSGEKSPLFRWLDAVMPRAPSIRKGKHMLHLPIYRWFTQCLQRHIGAAEGLAAEEPVVRR